MEHSNFKAKGENIDIFFCGYNENKFKLFKIGSDNFMSDITPTVNIVSIEDDIYKQNVTLPNEDCIIYCLFNNIPTIIRVGNPHIQVYLYSNTEDEILPYERFSKLGELIESGNLDYYGNNLYGFIPSDLDFSVLRVNNIETILNVPYMTVTETVYEQNSGGTLILNKNTWNLVAINVSDYRVSSFINEVGSDNIEAVNAFNNGNYLNFIVGVTPVGSTNDFYVTRFDSGETEIQPFFVKVKDIPNDISYDWGV